MTLKKIGFVIAMSDERKRLFKGGATEIANAGEFRMFRSETGKNRLLVIETGMGADRAAAGAAALLESAPIDLLVSIGFGGGVSDGLRAGEIVVAERLLRYSGGKFEESRCRLVVPEGCTLPPHRVGTVITTDGVAPKASLGRNLPAGTRNCVLEMETWGVARVAAERGMPLLCIRGISDGAGEEIHLPLEKITTSRGQVSLAKVMLQVARKPALVPHLIRLGKNAALAGKNLSLMVEGLLTTEPGSAYS